MLREWRKSDDPRSEAPAGRRLLVEAWLLGALLVAPLLITLISTL